MGEYEIVYYSLQVEEEIAGLPDSLFVRYVRYKNSMRVYGPNLKMPHTRAMGNGLFELRLIGKEGIARVFYCTLANHKIVMLHSFVKKTQETPRKELDIAYKRLAEVKKYA